MNVFTLYREHIHQISSIPIYSVHTLYIESNSQMPQNQSNFPEDNANDEFVDEWEAFVMLPQWIVLSTTISNNAKIVLMVIKSMCSWKCTPSGEYNALPMNTNTILKLCQMSYNTYNTARRELQDIGLLDIIPIAGKRNRYIIKRVAQPSTQSQTENKKKGTQNLSSSNSKKGQPLSEIDTPPLSEIDTPYLISNYQEKERDLPTQNLSQQILFDDESKNIVPQKNTDNSCGTEPVNKLKNPPTVKARKPNPHYDAINEAFFKGKGDGFAVASLVKVFFTDEGKKPKGVTAYLEKPLTLDEFTAWIRWARSQQRNANLTFNLPRKHETIITQVSEWRALEQSSKMRGMIPKITSQGWSEE